MKYNFNRLLPRKKRLTRGGNTAAIAGNESGSFIAAYVLFAAYFIIGIFGRFPWKADEPYSFSIVWNIILRGQWLVPYVAGDPFLEKPPLMFWLGALFAKALPGMVSHESSRLAVVLCIVVTVGSLLWAAAHLYLERGRRRLSPVSKPPSSAVWQLTALALLAAIPALAEHVHKFTADLGQLAGASLALAALTAGTARGAAPAKIKSAPLLPGMLFGAGTGMAFLSKGLLVAGIAGLALLCCLAILPAFRRGGGAGFSLAAVLGGLPFAVPWPLALYLRSPELFMEWFWVNNVGRFAGFTELGGHDNPLVKRLLSVMAGGAPLSVLLLAGLARAAVRGISGQRRFARLRRRLRHRPAYAAVVIFLIVGLTTLISSASLRDIYLLPLYPAMALAALPLAASGHHRGIKIRRTVNLLFGALLMLTLLTWLTLVRDGEPYFLSLLWPGVAGVFPVPFMLHADRLPLLAATALIVLWWTVIRTRSGQGVLMAWSAGLAMLWGTIFLLMMPWFDAARSYRTTFQALAPLVGPADCLATDGLGESELGLLHYVTGRAGTRIYTGWSGEGDGVTSNPASWRCDFLLVQDSLVKPVKNPPAHWREIWRGNRPADVNGFILYRRNGVENAGRLVLSSLEQCREQGVNDTGRPPVEIVQRQEI